MLPTEQVIEMPGAFNKPVPRYKPYGEIIQLAWEPVEMVGGLHLPKNAKAHLPFYRVEVLEAGPDAKLVKKGDWVIVPSQVILTCKWDGHTAYFTSENKVLAVVELDKPATLEEQAFAAAIKKDDPDAGASAQ